MMTTNLKDLTQAQDLTRLLVEDRFTTTYEAVVLYQCAYHQLTTTPGLRFDPLTYAWVRECARVLDHILADALARRKERDIKRAQMDEIHAWQQLTDAQRQRWGLPKVAQNAKFTESK
jgi:hypothetical protein